MKRIKCYGRKQITEIKLEKSLIRQFFDGNNLTYSSLVTVSANKDEVQSAGFQDKENFLQNKSQDFMFDSSNSKKWGKKEHPRKLDVKKKTAKIEASKPKRDGKKNCRKKVLKPHNSNTEFTKEQLKEPCWSEFEKYEFVIDCLNSGFVRPKLVKQPDDAVEKSIVSDSGQFLEEPINNLPPSTLTPRTAINSSAELFPETHECLEKSLKDCSKICFESTRKTSLRSQQSKGSRQLGTSKSSSHSCQDNGLSHASKENIDKLLAHNSAKDLSKSYNLSKDLFDSSPTHDSEIRDVESLTGVRSTKEVSASSSVVVNTNKDFNYCTASEIIAKDVVTSTPLVKPKSAAFYLFNQNLVSPVVKERQDSLPLSAPSPNSGCCAPTQKSWLSSQKTLHSSTAVNLPENTQNHASLRSRRKSEVSQFHSDPENASRAILSRIFSNSTENLTSIQPDPEQSDELTKNDLLLLCNQKTVVSFEDAYDWKSYKIQKIGEGTYGEVFLISKKKRSSVLKIIPISQSSDDNSYQNLKNVLSEVKISKCLSELRKNKLNQTKNFIKMNRVSLVCGAYPSILIDAWDAFGEEKSTYNVRPDIFDENQLFTILELDYGGKDLTCFVLRNASEAETVLKQITVALAVAEEAFLFEHRDLHMGNILVQRNKSKTVSFKLRGQTITFESRGLHVTLIDFTLSRLHENGYVFYYDLADDVSLFNQSGDIQFDIYRKMKEQLKNQWHECSLYSNVLWLNFLCMKLNEIEYSRPSSLKHKEALIAIECFKQKLTQADCALDCLKTCGILTKNFRFDRNRGKNSAKNSILVSRNSYQKSKLSLCK